MCPAGVDIAFMNTVELVHVCDTNFHDGATQNIEKKDMRQGAERHQEASALPTLHGLHAGRIERTSMALDR